MTEQEQTSVKLSRPKSVIGVRKEKRCTIAVSQSTMARLRQAALAGHTTVAKIVEHLSTGEQVQAAPTQIVTTAHTHDECAMEMLKLLPPEKFDLAKEICFDQLGIRPWQLVAGHLRKVADQGLLQAPLLDSRWDRIIDTPQISGMTPCAWQDCRTPFLPARLGQLYCSPECGGAAARATRPAPKQRDSGTAGLTTQLLT